MRKKADAEDRGEDIERQKNWEYTIEENDQWEKKLARKARRADFSFNGVFCPSSNFACGLTAIHRRCGCRSEKVQEGLGLHQA